MKCGLTIIYHQTIICYNWFLRKHSIYLSRIIHFMIGNFCYQISLFGNAIIRSKKSWRRIGNVVVFSHMCKSTLILSLLRNSIFENCNNKFGDFYIFINLINQAEIYYFIHWHFLKPPIYSNFDIHKKLFSIKFGIKSDCNTYFSSFWSLIPIDRFFQLSHFLY